MTQVQLTDTEWEFKASGPGEAPGPDWHDGYPKQAALVVGLQGCGTYAEAAQAAAAFINPMLKQTAQGTWSPDDSVWA
jgi:hypothetical protein